MRLQYRKFKFNLIALIFLISQLYLFSNISLAAKPLPQVTGKWLIIDDVTHKPTAIIEITADKNNTLSGKIVAGAGDNQGKKSLCTACTGDLKNQPITNMTIMSHLKQTSPNTWEDGLILDPDNGKTYHCQISLSQDGQALKVRGYIGISLLGRTQTWLRYHPQVSLNH